MHPFAPIFLTLCSFFATFFVDASNNQNGFSINLIHRDSPMSPLYDSSKTLSELVRNAATRSISRSNKLDFTIRPNIAQSPTLSSSSAAAAATAAESTIVAVPDHGEYLMSFSIGTPPIERLAMFDTGLDLTWVQCSPCKSCFPQDTPLFDPTQSSTYMDVPCDSQPCTLIPKNERDCGILRECFYLKQYVDDKSMNIGKLGSDSISFGSKGQGLTFPKYVFECSMYNNFTFPISSKTSGIVGLGAGQLSLVSQLGDQISHKFSYCLVPFTSTATGKLKFGNHMVPGNNGIVFTPLIRNPYFPSFYFLNLEGITIGTKRVQTSQSINGNMIIDSMNILTHLEQTLYNDFISSVKEVINVEAVVQDVPSPFEFCLTDGANMIFPDFVFHFTGGDLVLNKKNMFINLDNNMACMTVLPMPIAGISILGNWAQVDFLVEYDVGGKKISFAPTNCSTN